MTTLNQYELSYRTFDKPGTKRSQFGWSSV